MQPPLSLADKMKYSLATAILIALISLPVSVSGKASYMGFEGLVVRSDLIAIVEISSVASQGTNGHYCSVATLKITDGIKGCKGGDAIQLEYDNGAACPNVIYFAGETCLVFASRMTNGRYETCDSYYGKVAIEGDTCKGVAGNLNGKMADIIARIKAVLSTKKP